MIETLFVQIASGQVLHNTTVSGSLFGLGVGSRVIPANKLTVGSVLHVSLWGWGGAAGNNYITIRYGSTNLYVLPSATTNLPPFSGGFDSSNPQGWCLDTKILCRQAGVNGLISVITSCHTGFPPTIGTSIPANLIIENETKPMNTSSDSEIDVLFGWDVADSGNGIVCSGASIILMKPSVCSC